MEVLHHGHCNSRLSLVRLTYFFSLKTKFYSPEASHWFKSSLNKIHFYPRPSSVSKLDPAQFFKSNLIWPCLFLDQSSGRNASTKTSSSWCKHWGWDLRRTYLPHPEGAKRLLAQSVQQVPTVSCLLLLRAFGGLLQFILLKSELL